RLPREKVLALKASPICGKCEKPLLRSFDKTFDDLDPDSYIHPLDRETLAALKRIPGVSTLLRSLIKQSFELDLRLEMQANTVRVSKTQLPTIYARFEHAAACLGIKELPELYVYQDPVPNAYTLGVDRYYIGISTGCLEMLDDDEIEVMLAHELGHVHADHVLYKTATRVFAQFAGGIVQATLGIGALVIYPIQIALLRWDRASELSSDRAALLVMKNPNLVLRTLMKISGGTRRFAGELSVDAFVDQADNFGKMQEEGALGRYITLFRTLFRTHPYPIWRTKEVLEWVTTGNYLEILDGDYKTRALIATAPCPECGTANKVGAMVCTKCGHQLIAEPSGPDAEAAVREATSGHTQDPLSKAWGDVRGWYKRTFTTDGQWHDDAIEGEPPVKKDDDEKKPDA
ncbi:MAG TPA: M48 family metallopeptidase, partial [Myxococcota bacterium]